MCPTSDPSLLKRMNCDQLRAVCHLVSTCLQFTMSHPSSPKLRLSLQVSAAAVPTTHASVCLPSAVSSGPAVSCVLRPVIPSQQTAFLMKWSGCLNTSCHFIGSAINDCQTIPDPFGQVGIPEENNIFFLLVCRPPSVEIFFASAGYVVTSRA